MPGTGETVRGFSAPDLIVEDEAAYVDSFYSAVRPCGKQSISIPANELGELRTSTKVALGSWAAVGGLGIHSKCAASDHQPLWFELDI